MAYTVFESINMASTRGAARIFDVVATEDIENGIFGYLGDLADGESHIYQFVKGKKNGKVMVVADQPARDADTTLTSNQARSKFIIKAGTAFRVREVVTSDEFGITKLGFTSGSVAQAKEKAFVTIDASGKLVASTSDNTSAEEFSGVIMRKRISGGSVVAGGVTYGNPNEIFEIKVAKSFR